jgi:hypothetical protein
MIVWKSTDCWVMAGYPPDRDLEARGAPPVVCGVVADAGWLSDVGRLLKWLLNWYCTPSITAFFRWGLARAI